MHPLGGQIQARHFLSLVNNLIDYGISPGEKKKAAYKMSVVRLETKISQNDTRCKLVYTFFSLTCLSPFV